MKNIISTIAFLFITINLISQENNQMKLGDKIGEFSALDDQGNVWKSTSAKSDFLVVYFYPAAMTGGCTKQACAYRDDKASFDELGVTVIGISGDEVKNLKYFKDSYQLNFPLLSDNEGTISKIFGVPANKGGEITREIDGENFLLVRSITTPRWTFILNKERKVIYKNAEVNAVEDSKNVKEIIKNYSK
ncbi:peroxiredoxin [Lutibacter flavus]|uniref:thioredoxin-dependent peroxiredoxin n=1 Tax=Lutibacter flavus TaxID=691689 RepID=A0A238Z2P1_9FLAO|nr:peroxiredoxin [Lutibacter flavus]SNR77218.1 peroxiredoxin Q/BCP [Lutibacter flavus]